MSAPTSEQPGVAGHADPPDETPWVMHLVVRDERAAPPGTTDVLEAAASAVVRLLADERSAPGGPWEPEVSRWLDGRIRKICKRARGAAWARAAALPGLTVRSGTATVRAFVPFATDAVPPDLDKLQVRGLATADQPEPSDPATALAAAPAGTLVVAVDAGLGMSAGKSAAQVAHAANVAWLDADRDRRAAWTALDFPVTAVLAAPRWWGRWAAGAPITIHDAGFTEVAPGSCTAAATWA